MEIYQIPRNVSITDAQVFERINKTTGLPEKTPYPVINPALYENPYWVINRTSLNEKKRPHHGFLSARYNITDWLYHR